MNQTNLKKLGLVGTALGFLWILAGCSTPKYSCALEPGSPCKSMAEVWNNQTKLTSTRVTSVATQVAMPAELSATDAGFQDTQIRDPEGTPVYITGKPYMVWVPASQDAEGRVQSGRYVYFATPPAWTLGTLIEAKEGAGILGPKKPDGYRAAVPVSTVKSVGPQSQAELRANQQLKDQKTQTRMPDLLPIVRAPEVAK